MKRSTPRHPKLTDLANALKKELYAAAGILELLWHFTAEYAPRGDIGRHTDAAISKAVHWRGKPAFLIDALVSSRWLDRVDNFRLIVHDWPDHADDGTNMKLARAREFFCDGRPPSLKRLSGKERADAEQFYLHAVRTESTQEALYGEGLAMAEARLVVSRGGRGEFDATAFDLGWAWEEFAALYPRKGRTKQVDCRSAYLDFLQKSPSPRKAHETVMEKMRERWVISDKWEKGFVINHLDFIKNACWDEEPEPSLRALRAREEKLKADRETQDFERRYSEWLVTHPGKSRNEFADFNIGLDGEDFGRSATA